MFKTWLKEEDGQALTEYGLILGLLVIVVIGILIAIKGNVLEIFKKANTEIEKAAIDVSSTP